MKEVAKINGVAVYSDKTLQATINNEIHFTDGSWCNVSTGEIVNNGDGKIIFDKNDYKDDGNNTLEMVL